MSDPALACAWLQEFQPIHTCDVASQVCWQVRTATWTMTEVRLR